MFKVFTALCFAIVAIIRPGFAETPRVVTDILPVHSLVSIVMEGVDKPEVIVKSTASPHSFSLKPSQAELLENADLIFWIGEDLTPWLEESIDALAADAKSIELLHQEATHVLDLPEEHEGDDHGHGHGHETHDPHAWLDPENGKIWLSIIASELIKFDPENTDIYKNNAKAGIEKIKNMQTEVSAQLDASKGLNFIVAHDAYQYFGKHFNVSIAGAISNSDAETPSAAKIAKIIKQIKSNDVKCVFAEPQFNQNLITTVTENTNAKIAVLDPLGFGLDIGNDLYTGLFIDMSKSVSECVNL